MKAAAAGSAPKKGKDKAEPDPPASAADEPEPGPEPAAEEEGGEEGGAEEGEVDPAERAAAVAAEEAAARAQREAGGLVLTRMRGEPGLCAALAWSPGEARRLSFHQFCTFGAPDAAAAASDGVLYYEVVVGEGLENPQVGFATDGFEAGRDYYDGDGVGDCSRSRGSPTLDSSLSEPVAPLLSRRLRALVGHRRHALRPLARGGRGVRLRVGGGRRHRACHQPRHRPLRSQPQRRVGRRRRGRALLGRWLALRRRRVPRRVGRGGLVRGAPPRHGERFCALAPARGLLGRVTRAAEEVGACSSAALAHGAPTVFNERRGGRPSQAASRRARSQSCARDAGWQRE